MIPTPLPSIEEPRDRILQAAMERFTHYGYSKTTMAEIAKDCGMSAANLYRYFHNKLDIGETLARGCLDEKFTLMEAIVRQNDRAASERLRNLVRQILDYTHQQWSAMPHMNELVNAICGERMEMVGHYKQREHALLVTLLEEGNANAEFEVTDVDDSAAAIATAIMAFGHPLVMPMYSLDVFKQRADSVVNLMLKGLHKK